MTSGARWGERRWRLLLFGLTGLAIVVFLWKAFLIPGTGAYAPFTIADDARQFLAWTPALVDPRYTGDELIAQYWYSVSPPVFRWIYAALAGVGIEPVVAARIIPVVLLAFSAWAAWRLALMLTQHPAAAFVAAAFVMALLVRDNSIFSATPRAFAPPLLLLFFDALLRRKPVVLVLALTGLAAVYPSSALVALTMLGLSKVRLLPRPAIALSARSILLVGAATLAVALPAYALRDQTERWQPVITLEEALEMPNLGTAGGRSAIVSSSSAPAWLCSSRRGFVPDLLSCSKGTWAAAVNLLLLLPLLYLAAMAALPQRGQRPAARGRPHPIYLWALAACLLWWSIATAVAFELHLPARYSQRVLSMLGALAIGQLVGEWLAGRAPTAARHTAVAMLAALSLFLFATPKTALRSPSDPGWIDMLAQMQPATRVAGVADDLDFAPALTRTSVLATVEHAIPYHRGYFDPIARRLRDTLSAAAAPDSATFAEFVRQYRIDLFVADRALIERGQVPQRYAGVVPEAAGEAQVALHGRPSHLQRAAIRCALYRGEVWVLDAPCVAGAQHGETSSPSG